LKFLSIIELTIVIYIYTGAITKFKDNAIDLDRSNQSAEGLIVVVAMKDAFVYS